jgi:DNA-binding PadR family transcriptional regulator
MQDLTEKEKVLLLAIWQLKESAYGVFVRRHINEKIGKLWNYGTLYRMMDQLVKKELLNRCEGEPIPESGGRRKIFYTLTPKGLQALQDAFEFQKLLWKGITKITLEEET